ncbi:MAG: hypothetical protein WBD85_12720, partial [Mycobacterium sp.]
QYVAPPAPQPEPPPQLQRPGWSPPAETPGHQEQPDWQPVSSEGHWLPAEAPGSHWNTGQGDGAGSASWAYDNAPSRDRPSHRSPSIGESAPSVEQRGRHSSAAAVSAAGQIGEPAADWSEPDRRARARHSAEHSDSGISGSAPPPAMSPPPAPPPPSPPSAPDRGPVMTPPPPPNARHRNTDPLSDTDEPQSGGQSVAELLARLQTTPSEGGRRRRRED